jgi:rhamnogalacturonyl hydrolase YesR
MRLVPGLLVLGLLTSQAFALDLVSPRDGGVVLGDVVQVEVAGARAIPDEVRLDGVAVVTTWTALPYPRTYCGGVRLAGAPASHRIEVRVGAAWLRASFDDAGPTSIGVGDRVAAHIVAVKPPASRAWQWGPAVLMDGLHQFARVSPQRARWVAAVREHQQAHLGRLPVIDHPDRCAAGLTALSLWTEEGDATFLPSARIVADYLRQEPRNRLGAIDHLGARSSLRFWTSLTLVLLPWARSIWVDSLQMYALFAARHGAATGDVALRDFGLAQPGIFASAMQDPATGLFVHAWDVQRDRALGGVWLRGNGWAATTTADLLELCPAGHPERPRLEALLRAQCTGLLATQLASGLWDTLLDAPGAYEESSGSALVAYGLAKGARLGVLPPAARAAAKRAFRALTARLAHRADGLAVTGSSTATDAMPRFLYRYVPRRDDVEWGAGGYLRLAAELSQETWRSTPGIAGSVP